MKSFMRSFIYAFLMVVFGVSSAMALNVGYYEMCDGQGSLDQVNSINIAGHTPVNLTDLSAADLAGVDVIYVQNCDNDGYGAEYLSRLADIEAAVASGKRLIIHDRYVSDEVNGGGLAGTSSEHGDDDGVGVNGAEVILPGGAGFTFVRDFNDDANINILDNSTTVTNGPGGVLNDASLDGGNSSSHGYSVAGSLPVDASLILSRSNPDEIVTFSYPYGSGCVVYSTIPLDFYLGGSGNNPPRDNMALIYAPNVVAYAADGCAAVLGVADDVPGTDVVIPLICEKDGTMNTLWAVGDLFANGAADILVYDRRSELIYDDFEEWTSDAPDVVVSDCQSLVASMSEMQKAALEMSIDGRTYYVGYLVYFNVSADSDQFIPWVYLVDLLRGFASGYNGFAAEGGVSLLTLAEGLGLEPVTATALFPRYYIGNDNPETWNWWITLLGSNDGDRELAGFICNEEEDCVSLSIPIPDELNIIDVEPYVPALLHAGYPKAGMGVFAIINGDDQTRITTLGWSYQRLEASTVSASWDVIHPMHRDYGLEN